MANFDLENIFWQSVRFERLNKYYSQLAILSKAKVPDGIFVELGVFKATSLVRLASYLKFLYPTATPTFYGFDAFGRFPRPSQEYSSDAKFLDKFERDAGDGLSIQEVRELLMKDGVDNVQLIKGDISETFPAFLRQVSKKICFLHVDLDLYEPTYFALVNALPYLTNGSIIMFDDYLKVESATDAINLFLDSNQLKIQCFDGSSQPYFTVI